MPGAEFGALDIDGNLKARGDGPAWSGESPQQNGSVDVTCTGRGRNQRCTQTYVTAYNSSNPYLGWLSGYQLRSHRGYGKRFASTVQYWTSLESRWLPGN